MEPITYQQFEKVHIAVGRIVSVHDFPEAKKPAYKLEIDFGPEIGVKWSSSMITVHYTKEVLVGQLIYAVINFAPKQIGKFFSEVLVLGTYDAENAVIIAQPEREVAVGSRLL